MRELRSRNAYGAVLYLQAAPPSEIEPLRDRPARSVTSGPATLSFRLQDLVKPRKARSVQELVPLNPR